MRKITAECRVLALCKTAIYVTSNWTDLVTALQAYRLCVTSDVIYIQRTTLFFMAARIGVATYGAVGHVLVRQKFRALPKNWRPKKRQNFGAISENFATWRNIICRTQGDRPLLLFYILKFENL